MIKITRVSEKKKEIKDETAEKCKSKLKTRKRTHKKKGENKRQDSGTASPSAVGGCEPVQVRADRGSHEIVAANVTSGGALSISPWCRACRASTAI